MKNMVLVIYATSVIGGFLVFFIAGGIPKLASDVGVTGAWGLSIFIQFIYATILTLGFIVYAFIARKYKILSPTVWSVIVSSLVISIVINLYGIFSTGPGVDFTWGALLVIVLAIAMNGITAVVNHGLTRPITRIRR